MALGTTPPLAPQLFATNWPRKKVAIALYDKYWVGVPGPSVLSIVFTSRYREDVERTVTPPWRARKSKILVMRSWFCEGGAPRGASAWCDPPG